ncbi:hypothetical protein [Mycobacterium syngnathidarum]
MDQDAFDRRIEADARRDDMERRAIRRSRRFDRIATLVLVIGLALGLGGVAVLVSVANQQGLATIPEPLSGQFFAELHRLVAGKLDPNVALTAVLAAAGLCATINVALALEHRSPDWRVQVALSDWRDSLDSAARVVFVFVVAIGGLVWANLGRPESVGTAALTSLFAVVAAQLASSIRRQVTSAEQTTRYARAVKRLAMLDMWQTALKDRHVPQPLGVVDLPDDARGVWLAQLLRACVRAYAWRVAGIAFGCAVYVGVIAALFGAPVRFFWTGDGAFLVLFPAGLAALVSVAILIGGVMRWGPSGIGSVGPFDRRRHRPVLDPRSIRWQLDTRPRLVLGAYWLYAGLQLWAVQHDAGMFTALLLAGPTVVAPIAVWIALWASRHEPHARWAEKATGWAQKATRPTWGCIELLMHHERLLAQREHHRFGMQREEDGTAVVATQAISPN